MKTWRYIKEDNFSAHRGLATDEYLMNLYSENNQTHEACLRLYTYRDYCSLVGRFQNIHAELDLEACENNNIQYNRRLTGGGAIIMGQGQLGLCLATANTFQSVNIKELYKLFSTPVIMALDQLGIKTQLRGKNDLEANGKKIAGLGIHINPYGAIQFHTSLLVDLDIPKMLQVLKIPLQKINDKDQIDTVAKRITTISRELERNASIDEVRDIVKNCFQTHFGIQMVKTEINKAEIKEINKISSSRYLSEEWIFQNSPQTDMTGMGLKKTKAGLLRTYIALKGETLKSVLITGDFCGNEKLFTSVERRLKWHAANKEMIQETVIKAFNENNEPCDLTPEDVINSIWRATLGAMKEARHTYQGSCYYPKKKMKSEIIKVDLLDHQ